MQTSPFTCFLFFSFWRVHWNMCFVWASLVCLKWKIALDQMYFQQGWLTLVKLSVPVPREVNPKHPGRIFFVQCPGLIFLTALWSGPATSASILISFGFVKVCGIRFSIWESFIGFYICGYPITTILACLFSVGVRISWKKKLRWSNEDNNNYRISFIDLYLVFPRNFRIVIFPHTTRTELWYYHRAWVTCAEIYKKALEVQILNEVELRQVLRKRVSFQDRKNKNTPKSPSIKLWYKQHSDATQE